MVVAHMVIPHRELLAADQCRLFYDQTLGQGEAGVDRLFGDGIEDVLHLERDRVRGDYKGKVRVRVHLVVHVSGAVQLGEGLAKNAPRPATVTLQQRSQRAALRLVGPLVNQVGCDPVSFVNRGRPVGVQADVQVVESQVAVGPLFDVPGPAALTLARGGTPVHIARTPVIALARDDDLTLDHPVSRLHGCDVSPQLHILPARDCAISGCAATSAAPPIRAAPIARPKFNPRGKTFSTKTTSAITAAHSRPIAPAPTKTAISAQQQPRQYKPCSRPRRNSPATPWYQWVRRKSIGLRQTCKHFVLRGVNW